ncbi:MAG: hypothetical protein IIW93_06430 [Bacteroidaceae bacterium]|nr:hypothetical protein [Bacteroidaceae bacterium]
MKKLFSMVLIMASGLTFFSCSSDEEIYKPQDVKLTLDYTLVDSGSMSRGVGEDTYNNFYDKYIKTKKLTPQNYVLTFTNTETNEVILNKKSAWNSKDGIVLPEGTYKVSGYSHPSEMQIESVGNFDFYYPSDTVFMAFDEVVSVTKDMTKLTLKANYDSYLLLFDTANTESIELGDDSGRAFTNNYSKTLAKDDNCHWVFMNGKAYAYAYQISKTYYYSFVVNQADDNNIKLFTGSETYEKGKYYYYQYNGMTNSFDIPKMESGN